MTREKEVTNNVRPVMKMKIRTCIQLVCGQNRKSMTYETKNKNRSAQDGKSLKELQWRIIKDLYTVSQRKLCQCYFLKNSVK